MHQFLHMGESTKYGKLKNSGRIFDSELLSLSYIADCFSFQNWNKQQH